MSRTIDELPTPCLLVDLERLERNITRMQTHCARLGVRLRPHIKTHKCVEVGLLQRSAGAAGITASTLYEAEVFAEAGFDDITWAFPLILSRIDQAAQLAEAVDLGIVVDSLEAVAALGQRQQGFRTWIKVDCGYHRAGVDPESERPVEIAAALRDSGQELVGLLSHSGNAYDAQTLEARAAVTAVERDRIVGLAERLRALGHAVPEVSVGSTPGVTAAEDLAGVTEVRPGNYVYFDLTQVRIGSCTVQDCAATVLTSVVSTSSGHSIVDAGALAMSQDPGLPPKTMGEVFADYRSSTLDEEVRLVGLSQEHGKLSRALPIGTRVRVLPNHSCLTVACFPHCYAVRGDRVLAPWRIANGR